MRKQDEIEVLYKQEYVGRIIYAIKYKDKVTFVYKRSGFNNPNSVGEIVPFMYLNARRTIRGPVFGYIFKEYLRNGRYIEHRKNFYAKEEMFLKEIAEIVANDKITQTPEEMDEFVESSEFKILVNEINDNLRHFEKEFGLLDYGNF